MATYRTRTGKKGTTVTVMVRIAGFPTETATFPNKTAAKKWASKTEADILEGRTSKDSKGRKATLADAIDRFRREVLPLLKDGSMYGFTLDWWKSQHGETRLGDVSRGWLVECRGTLLTGTYTRAKPGAKRSMFKSTIGGHPAPGPVVVIAGTNPRVPVDDYSKPRTLLRTPATCNRYMAALSSVFSQVCGDWEWLQPSSNPFTGLQKLPEGRNKGKAYTEEARAKLLLETAKDAQLHVLTMLSLSTAARAGELLGLTWANVEIGETEGRLMFVDTKNGDTRIAWVFGDALEALRDHHFRWNRDGYVDAGGNFIPGSPMVFPGEWSHTKKAHGRYDYLKPLHEALKRAGLTMKRPFHALRHTAATSMASKGANGHQLKALGGWKSNAVDTYVHLAAQDTKELARAHQARLTQGDGK